MGWVGRGEGRVDMVLRHTSPDAAAAANVILACGKVGRFDKFAA